MVMDATFFSGHCPVTLGDTAFLKNGRHGRVTMIRTVQDFFLIDNKKSTKVEFIIHLEGVGFFNLEDISRIDWIENGIIRSKIL